MGDEVLEVWVELFESDETQGRNTIKSAEKSYFRRARTNKAAFFAAELMCKAQDSRKAAKEVINKQKVASEKRGSKRWGTDGALQKLKGFGQKHQSNTSICQRISVCVDLLDDGSSMQVAFKNVHPANKQELIKSTSDLTGLTYMEEPNVLRSLQQRYETEKGIYTNIASIVVALNPYCSLNIYSSEYMMRYRKNEKQSLDPHIFAVGEEAYSILSRPFSKRRQPAPTNQSVIICGESGSGKTESAKYMMRYLANRSHDLYKNESSGDTTSSHERLVEKQVLEANNILEAFGNANTLLNHNSSRFGKFTKLFFATANVGAGEGNVIGASTDTYLLEKSRLVMQNPGERNFHIFYQLCSGLNQDEREQLHLDGFVPRDFHYINQGECFEVKGINDKEWFNRVVKAFETLGINNATRMKVFGVISGLLHLGNIDFEEDPDTPDQCRISAASFHHVETCAAVLGINDVQAIAKRVSTIRIKTPGEYIEKKLSVKEAAFNRNSIAKTVYDNLFRWVVASINKTLSKTQNLPWIGILDVFGFESFVNNSFEQFCINFANEMLQQHFNNAILLSEQREYSKEAILWTPIDVPDNQDTIDLISEKSMGALSLLDSACKMRGTTVDAFVDSLFKQHKNHPRLQKPSRKKNKALRYGFAIEHYAGAVTYNCDEFLLKNNDSTDPDTITLFASSSSDVVQELFKPESDDDDADAGDKSRRRRKPKTRFNSVSAMFKRQLKELLETLSSTDAHFIRCVKPNTKVESWKFDMDYVRPQLRCGGLVEAVRMLKIGFPTRVSFDAVYTQYSPLLNPEPPFLLNRRDFSQAVLFLFGLRRTEYQLGLSKVFFRAGKRAFLETVMNRDEKLSHNDMEKLLGFIYRKKWQRLIAAAKAYSLIWRSIVTTRMIEKCCRTIRIVVIYNRTFKPLLFRVRKQLAVTKAQAAVRTYFARLHTMEKIEKERLEQQRQQMREKAERERIEREKAEHEKELQRQEEIRLQEEQTRKNAAEEAENVFPMPISNEPKHETISAVTNIRSQSRLSMKTASNTETISAKEKQRYLDVMEENKILKSSLLEAKEEIVRLKIVVDELDDINNKLVEDLTNELVLRTQLSDEAAYAHQASSSYRVAEDRTMPNVDDKDEENMAPFAPPTMRVNMNRTQDGGRNSDCNVM